METEQISADLLAFIEKWKDIIDGKSKTAERWARIFEIEAQVIIAQSRAAIAEAKGEQNEQPL